MEIIRTAAAAVGRLARRYSIELFEGSEPGQRSPRESEMTESEREMRAQLTEKIAAGDPDLLPLIAAVLVGEVLPALDRIEERLGRMRFDYPLAAMVLAQIHTIYEFLHDMSPSNYHDKAWLAEQRLRYQERLENALRHLEEKQ
jgi:hypothetical protein